MQGLSDSEDYEATAPLLNGTYVRLREYLARLVTIWFCCNDSAGNSNGTGGAGDGWR